MTLGPVEIAHPVPVEDATEWVRTLASGLLGNPYDDEFPRRVHNWARDWLAERTWAVRDRGRIVGTLATEPRTLTVPAGVSGSRDVPIDALTGVSVAATHRRRGLLTQMISASLADARDRGDALSALIAAEWPIYGRFGYGPAARSAEYTYRPRGPGGQVAGAPRCVRQVEPDELI
jgi:GNAT superfamily N-acetyltransferase